MPTKRARLYPRDANDSKKEYHKGIRNIDRPVWKEEQAKDMETRYAQVTDELADFRKKAVIKIRKLFGTAVVPIYLRPVLAAWRLVKLEVPADVYNAEINAIIAKNRLRREDVNKLFQELGLPTVR